MTIARITGGSQKPSDEEDYTDIRVFRVNGTTYIHAFIRRDGNVILGKNLFRDDLDNPIPKVYELMQGTYGQEYADFISEWKDKITHPPSKMEYYINKDRLFKISIYENGNAHAIMYRILYDSYGDKRYRMLFQLRSFDRHPDVMKELKAWAVKNLDTIRYINFKNLLEQYNMHR